MFCLTRSVIELFGLIVSHFGNYVFNAYVLSKCFSYRKIRVEIVTFVFHGFYLARGSGFPYGNFLVIYRHFQHNLKNIDALRVNLCDLLLNVLLD